MAKKKEEKKEKKKKVCEVFEIKKDGEEKTVKVCGKIEEEERKKGQIKKENKILRNMFIAVGVIVLIGIISYFYTQSLKEFEYRGLDFKLVEESNLLFYNTAFPVQYQGKKVQYNFYIRNDPRKLEREIPFEGEVRVNDLVAMKSGNESFNCEGFGIIAVQNLMNLLNLMRTKVVRDENATCDEEGRYAVIELKKGEKSMIRETSPGCYEFIIKDCEILKVTERFMVETFVKIDQMQSH